MNDTKKFIKGNKQAIADFRRAFHDWELRGLMFFGAIIILIGVVFYMWNEG